jgi:hypothetical protein
VRLADVRRASVGQRHEDGETEFVYVRIRRAVTANGKTGKRDKGFGLSAQSRRLGKGSGQPNSRIVCCRLPTSLQETDEWFKKCFFFSNLYGGTFGTAEWSRYSNLLADSRI